MDVNRKTAAGGTAEQLLLGVDALQREHKEPPPRRKVLPPDDHVFFAIPVPNEVQPQVVALQTSLRREHELAARPIASHRLHISLHSLGPYTSLPLKALATAIQAGAAVKTAPFQVTFDRVLSFRSSGALPLVLAGGPGLIALCAVYTALGVKLVQTFPGLPVRSSFTPHVTLLYVDHPIAEQAIETISWTVHEFVLIHSVLGRRQHIVLVRFPLRG